MAIQTWLDLMYLSRTVARITAKHGGNCQKHQEPRPPWSIWQRTIIHQFNQLYL